MINILNEIEKHLILDEKPSIYLSEIKEELVNTPLEILYKLQKIEQHPEYHPEGCVWNHVMQVVDKAAILREYANNKKCFMLAALLHDVGKEPTTKRNKQGKLISYDHDKVGSNIVRDILLKCNVDEEEVSYIATLVRYHMHHLYIIKNLPFGDVSKMIKEANMNDIILLFLCDRLGRNQKTKEEKAQEINDVKAVITILKERYNIDVESIERNLSEINKFV